MKNFDVVIVGGGHGGAQAAIALRQAKFEGSIAIVSNEAVPPYERPPLSKDYLAGEKPFERILIRPEKFWSERGIELLLNSHVDRVDPQERKLCLLDGGEITYGRMIWAAGAMPRMLLVDGGNRQGVHVIRTISDVNAIMGALATVQQVAIIGGGYIGLEAAAIMRKMGKEVVLLEAQERVLARVAGEPLSRFYEEEHRRQGVDIRLNARISALDGDDHVTGILLEEGSRIPAQMVIVGIGVVPCVGPLIRAGAAGSGGVDVDEYCRTSLPDIFAIGDCAAHANDFAGGVVMRVESVQNANDMASSVAKSICGELTRYYAVPWFWSNQYDLKLQTVGLLTGYDQSVLRGDPAERSFSVIYLKSGKVIALDCVNRTKDYVQGRALVMAGAAIDAQMLADQEIPLKEMIGQE